MKRCLTVLTAFFALLLTGADIRDLLAPAGGAFWDRGPEDIRQAAATDMKWSNKKRTQLRYSRSKNPAPLIWERTTPVCEALFDFDAPNGKLAGMTVSIYNRGDAGPMTDGAFRKLREQAEGIVSGLAGVGKPERDRVKLGGEQLCSRVWRSADVRWRLLWCESARGPEYLTLKIVRPDAPEERLRSTVRSSQDRRALPDRVKTDEEGRKFLDIPMIDQGDKGYCAAATVARVLRYYGADVDQNQIAQLLGTDSAAGTSWNVMLRKLEQAKSRLNARPRIIYANRDFETPDYLKNFLSRYGRIARKMKKPVLKFGDFVEMRNRRQFIRLELLNKSLDPEVIRELHLRDRNLPRFRQEVQSAIDRGLPLLWMIPGHIRLIIGVDGKRDMALFSDSWGAAHEHKAMPIPDAFGMTVRLLVLEPR